MVDIAKNISEMGQLLSSASLSDLQLAGNISVQVTGPAIDQLSGSNPDVMSLTHQAWVKNGDLAGATDLGSARNSFMQMTSLYTQAYQKAQPYHVTSPTPAYHAPAPSPASPYATPSAPIPQKSPLVALLTTAIGGIGGFVLGGPVGALVGAGAGFGVGYKIGK
jgi:hypothetical protein